MKLKLGVGTVDSLKAEIEAHKMYRTDLGYIEQFKGLESVISASREYIATSVKILIKMEEETDVVRNLFKKMHDELQSQKKSLVIL